MRNLLKIALAYRARGWSFYPTQPRSKRPYFDMLPVDGVSANGNPRHVWKPYASELPTGAEIYRWFTADPHANLAIITGQLSGLVIIDIDNQEAETAFFALVGIDRFADLQTPIVRSRHGYHLYFQHPSTGDFRGKLGIPGIDLKADGGCCTAPPSIHQSGHVYRFSRTPTQCELAPLPQAVLDAVAANTTQFRPTPMPVAPNRNLSNYACAALANQCRRVATAQNCRNNTLVAAACGVGNIIASGLIDAETAFAALYNSALEAGLTPSEIGPTIQSGFKTGMQSPYCPPDLPKPTSKTYQPTRYGKSHNGLKPPKYAQFPGSVR